MSHSGYFVLRLHIEGWTPALQGDVLGAGAFGGRG